MNKSCGGFIFLFTLLLTCIVSLLFLGLMQQLLLYQKTLSRREISHQYYYQLEAIAWHVAHSQINKQVSCLTSAVGANEVVKKIQQRQGCILKIKSREYIYLIEDLDLFPCLLGSKRIKQATHHWRITVGQFEEEELSSSLQIRFVALSAEKSQSHCPGKEQFIHLGVSSWRYLLHERPLW